MKVSIKNLNVQMDLKTKGMELEIRDPQGNFQGDLVVSKSSLIWCKGKVTPKNGIKKSWEEVIKYFEDEE